MLLLLSSLLLLSAAAAPPKLTGDNFYEEVAAGRTFVFFHSPDCGHCRAMLPEWEALGDQPLPDGCRLGSLDVTLEPAIADRFEVYGFPALLLLEPSEGKMYEFRGERTAEAFSSFLEPEGFRGEVRWLVSSLAHQPLTTAPVQSCFVSVLRGSAST